jgi:hypothetical protein
MEDRMIFNDIEYKFTSIKGSYAYYHCVFKITKNCNGVLKINIADKDEISSTPHHQNCKNERRKVKTLNENKQNFIYEELIKSKNLRILELEKKLENFSDKFKFSNIISFESFDESSIQKKSSISESKELTLSILNELTQESHEPIKINEYNLNENFFNVGNDSSLQKIELSFINQNALNYQNDSKLDLVFDVKTSPKKVNINENLSTNENTLQNTKEFLLNREIKEYQNSTTIKIEKNKKCSSLIDCINENVEILKNPLLNAYGLRDRSKRKQIIDEDEDYETEGKLYIADVTIEEISIFINSFDNANKLIFNDDLEYLVDKPKSLRNIQKLSKENTETFLKFKEKSRNKIYGPFKIVKDQNQGFIVKTTNFVKENTLIAEYAGQVKKFKRNIDNDSVMSLVGKLVIVPDKSCNLARFVSGISDSKKNTKDENIYSMKFNINDEPHVCLISKRNIESDETLYYDYNSGDIKEYDVSYFV